jgi:RimJ/RimL family protein N-acetyltransferase
MAAVIRDAPATPGIPVEPAIEPLGDGRTIRVRALLPSDRADFLAALERVSDESMRLRFFGPRRGFSAAEIDSFTAVDFTRHVALVAVIETEHRNEIVGGARYVMVKPGTAEIAFCVVDACQGQGVGTALMAQLVAAARRAGLKELVAEILPENAAMLSLCAHAGLALSTRREAGVVHLAMAL